MRHEWLINEGRERLILFFAGWGMDACPFDGIDALSSDVLVLSGYHTGPGDDALDESCAGYARCDVLAWSLGVVMAGAWCAIHKALVTRAVAVSGTPFAAHDDWGIPCGRFNGTIDQLSEASLQQFYRRMCGTPPVLQRFQQHAPARDVDDLRRELIFLRDQPPCPVSVFTQALVSSLDRIIPPANQQCCWQAADVPCRDIEAPHFPFYSITSWEELLDASN